MTMDSTQKVEVKSDVEEGALTDVTPSTPSRSRRRFSRWVPTDDGTPKRPRPERQLRRAVAARALPGLVLHVFHIDSEAHVEEFDDAYDGLNEALGAEGDSMGNSMVNTDEAKAEKSNFSSYWVDIDADERDRQEVNEWMQKLNFGSLITDTITKSTEEWISHVVSTRSKALIMIRILPLTREDGSFVTDNVEYLSAVKTKHMLLTYTTTQSGGRRSINKESIAYMTRDECLQDGSSNAALISWLEFHVFRTRKILTKIRRHSMVLSKRQDRDPSSVPLEELMQFRDKLLIVLAVAEEQSQCLGMIRKMDQDTDSVDFKKLKGALSILIATAESTERMGTRLEKRGKGLKNTFESHQQDRMNRRLAVLTVVSAIFMPLTFIAGIYGMNFVNIPELEKENGYFVLLGSMFVIAASMLAFFHYHGWFI